MFYTLPRSAKLVTQSTAAMYLGITPQAIGVWARRPSAPVVRKGNGYQLQWPEFPRWREAELERDRQPAELAAARARREAAMADLAELELATKRGELMDLVVFEEAVEQTHQHVRARLQNLAVRAGPVLVGCRSAVEAQTRLEPYVTEVIDQLRGTGEVGPDVEDADAA